MSYERSDGRGQMGQGGRHDYDGADALYRLASL